jgi:hypothetical protein
MPHLTWKLLTAAASVQLLACASVTDPVATGPDTFMVSARGVMGNSSAGQEKVKAYQQANAFCESRGHQMTPVNVTETAGGFGRIASGDVEFRCGKK